MKTFGKILFQNQWNFENHGINITFFEMGFWNRRKELGYFAIQIVILNFRLYIALGNDIEDFG